MDNVLNNILKKNKKRSRKKFKSLKCHPKTFTLYPDNSFNLADARPCKIESSEYKTPPFIICNKLNTANAPSQYLITSLPSLSVFTTKEKMIKGATPCIKFSNQI